MTFLVAVVIGRLVLQQFGYSTPVLNLLTKLLVALAVIRTIVYALRVGIVQGPMLKAWEQVISSSIWILVALHLLGLLQPLMQALDSLATWSGSHARIAVLGDMAELGREPLRRPLDLEARRVEVAHVPELAGQGAEVALHPLRLVGRPDRGEGLQHGAQAPHGDPHLVDLVGAVVDAGRPFVAVPVRQDRVVGDAERAVHLDGADLAPDRGSKALRPELLLIQGDPADGNLRV